MLPDDYENLSQSVIASNFMSGNILSSLTSKNYWNALNDYKPLMHLWYLGILVEFYIVFPALMIMFDKAVRRKRRDVSDYRAKTNIFLGLLCVVSILCYLNPFTFGINPNTVEGIRFYWLQNRFFEICLGGLVGLNISSLSFLSRRRWISPVSIWMLLGVIGIGLVNFDITAIGSHLPVVGAAINYRADLVLPPKVLLFLTVILSCIVVAQNHDGNPLSRFLVRSEFLAHVGRMSLSIFVFHQILIAFYRYYVTNALSPASVAAYLAVVLCVSFVTYRLVEQKVRGSKTAWACIGTAWIVTSAAALMIYLNAGVVRDVPELDVAKNDVHRNMHAEYCDRIYQYDREFTQDDGRIKVLIIGNSFARDWANILLESEMKDKIEISYIYANYQLDKLDRNRHVDRIRRSDYVFIFANKSDVPEYLWENVKDADRVFGIGTKNFGQNNGSIYRHRNEPGYFAITVAGNPEYEAVNRAWAEEWRANYLDMIEKVRAPDGRIRVFSDERKFISQDCEHLTRGGARFYAGLFDMRAIFSTDTQ